MKKILLQLGLIALLVGGGYILFKGIEYVYKRSFPQEKLMRTLEAFTHARREQGYLGKQALVLSLAEGSRVVLVGSVQGNDESLKLIVRGLQQAGLLSKAGELAPNTYLILNGDMLGATSSNGTVLETIVQLMSRNPERIWYLRGPEENVDTLSSHFASFFGAQVSSSHLAKIQAFIATLPLGIYLFSQDLKEDPLRLSAYEVDSGLFDRIACSAVAKKEPIRALCRLNDLCYYNEGALLGTIDGDDEGIDWVSMKGLERSDSSWHLISSPTVENRQRYGYDISAYAVFDIGKSLATSFLTLYHTNKGSEEFVQGVRYQIGSNNGSKEKRAAS